MYNLRSRQVPRSLLHKIEPTSQGLIQEPKSVLPKIEPPTAKTVLIQTHNNHLTVEQRVHHLQSVLKYLWG
jgi:hypothetical protein